MFTLLYPCRLRQKPTNITLILLLVSQSILSQATVLLDGNGAGGFELPGGLAGNGWTTRNLGQVHGWASGIGIMGASGGQAAFMTADYQSLNPTVQFNAAAPAASFSHLYRDISLPANAENIILSFKFHCNHQVTNPGLNPPLRVYADTTLGTNTFTAGALPASGVNPIYTGNAGIVPNWSVVVVQLNPAFAGRTIRLAFTSSTQATVNTASPFGMQIDSVSLVVRSGGQSLTNLKPVGDWFDASNWSGGYIPGPSDNVTVAAGSVLATGTNSSVITGAITVNGTLNVGRGLTSNGAIQVNGGGNFLASTNTINVAGNFTVASGAAVDMQAGVLAFVNEAGTQPQSFNFVSPSQFTAGRVSALIINNPAGVSILGSADPLVVYSFINLTRGVFQHFGRIVLNHAAVSSTAAPLQVAIAGGSFAAFPPVAPTNRLELRYLRTVGIGLPDTTMIVGASNELPPDRIISRLTLGSALITLLVNDTLFLDDNNINTLWVFGTIKVATGKAIVLTNSTYPGGGGTSYLNQGHVQGTLVFTINGNSLSDRVFPVGSGGTRRVFILRGITASNARVAVECMAPAGGTPGFWLSALGETHRWYARVLSGSLTSVDSILVQASVAEGFSANSTAQRRIARSATLDGVYSDVSSGIGSFRSSFVNAGEVVRSTSGNYNALGYFAPALSSGSFMKTWSGFANTSNWEDAANWTGNTLPTCSTEVSIVRPFSTIMVGSNSVCGNLALSGGTVVQVKPGARLTLGCGAGSGTQITLGGPTNRLEVLTGGEVRVQ